MSVYVRKKQFFMGNLYEVNAEWFASFPYLVVTLTSRYYCRVFPTFIFLELRINTKIKTV